MWLIDILPFVYDNFTELWGMMLEGIEEASDLAYILAYVSAVIILTLKLSMWAGALTIPKIVWDLLKKLWINIKIITQIQKNITKNLKSITNKATGIITVSKKAGKYSSRIKDFADNTNTAIQRFKWTSDELINSKKALNVLSNTIVLANIFWENIQTQLDNKNNTDIALKVYEEQILKENGFVLSELENQIGNSSWELKYNLLRIREKFDEIRYVFEREVFPVKEKIDELTDNSDILWLSKIDKYYKAKLWEMNELTQLILLRYILGK